MYDYVRIKRKEFFKKDLKDLSAAKERALNSGDRQEFYRLCAEIARLERAMKAEDY